MNHNPSYRFLLVSAAAWCCLVSAPPLAASVGMHDLATVGYRFFSHVCHQYDSHSFHIFGMKLGVCIRCSSIYFGFFGGALIACLPNVCLSQDLFRAGRARRQAGLLSRRGGRRFTALFVAAMLPMVLDVVLDMLGLHRSGDVTRSVTGLIFGIGSGILLTPYIVEGFSQYFELVKGRRHAKT